MKDLRIIGIFPLIFGLWTTILYILKDQAYQLLWFCNINNFLLAIAIFFRIPVFVWVATIWLIIGTPLWLYEDILLGDFRPHAVFVHVVSPIIGLYWIKKNPITPKFVIWANIIMGSLSQLSARIFTLPEHNVNMAHKVYPTLTEIFPNYLIYNVFNYVSFIISIFILVKLIDKYFVRNHNQEL